MGESSLQPSIRCNSQQNGAAGLQVSYVITRHQREFHLHLFAFLVSFISSFNQQRVQLVAGGLSRAQFCFWMFFPPADGQEMKARACGSCFFFFFWKHARFYQHLLIRLWFIWDIGEQTRSVNHKHHGRIHHVLLGNIGHLERASMHLWVASETKTAPVKQGTHQFAGAQRKLQ